MLQLNLTGVLIFHQTYVAVLKFVLHRERQHFRAKAFRVWTVRDVLLRFKQTCAVLHLAQGVISFVLRIAQIAQALLARGEVGRQR